MVYAHYNFMFLNHWWNSLNLQTQPARVIRSISPTHSLILDEFQGGYSLAWWGSGIRGQQGRSTETEARAANRGRKPMNLLGTKRGEEKQWRKTQRWNLCVLLSKKCPQLLPTCQAKVGVLHLQPGVRSRQPFVKEGMSTLCKVEKD